MSRHEMHMEGDGKAFRKAQRRLDTRRFAYDLLTEDEKRSRTRPGSMKTRRN